jgi:hypothetical protein
MKANKHAPINTGQNFNSLLDQLTSLSGNNIDTKQLPSLTSILLKTLNNETGAIVTSGELDLNVVFDSTNAPKGWSKPISEPISNYLGKGALYSGTLTQASNLIDSSLIGNVGGQPDDMLVESIIAIGAYNAAPLMGLSAEKIIWKKLEYYLMRLTKVATSEVQYEQITFGGASALDTYSFDINRSAAQRHLIRSEDINDYLNAVPFDELSQISDEGVVVSLGGKY